MSKLSKNFLKKILPKPVYALARRMVWAYRDMQNCKEAKYNKAKYNKASEIYGLNQSPRDFSIIVSFTTFPARIHSAAYVADALLRQTLKADAVILVLAQEEFSGISSLPKEYDNLIKRGLRIVFTKNLKPHKKYHYAMSEFPETLLVTVDDDLFYPEDLLERLYAAHKLYPYAVVATRAHRIKLENAELLNYEDWEHEVSYTGRPEFDLLATGCAGALYPPHCMYADLLDINLITQLCLNADDIWLKTMQVLKNTPVFLANNGMKKLVEIKGTQKNALFASNGGQNQNDVYITNCIKQYALTPSEFAFGRNNLNAEKGKNE